MSWPSWRSPRCAVLQLAAEHGSIMTVNRAGIHVSTLIKKKNVRDSWTHIHVILHVATSCGHSLMDMEDEARRAVNSLLKGIKLPLGLSVKLDCSSRVQCALVRVEETSANPNGQLIVSVKNLSFESIKLQTLIRAEIEQFVATRNDGRFVPPKVKARTGLKARMGKRSVPATEKSESQPFSQKEMEVAYVLTEIIRTTNIQYVYIGTTYKASSPCKTCGAIPVPD
jgi:hypothetical protein